MLQKKCQLNKPLIVGLSVLNIAKTSIFDFHYNVLKKLYDPNQLKLLYTDTDSLYYHITSNDIISDFKKIQHKLDCSEYPKNHPLYSLENKAKYRYFKDDSKGKSITEFIGFRSKMYSLLYQDGKSKAVGKGISRVALKNQLTHDTYKKCLDTNMSSSVKIANIRSKNHELYTIESNKTALSVFDDKRYTLHDGKSTLSYGHHRIDTINIVDNLLNDIFNLVN